MMRRTCGGMAFLWVVSSGLVLDYGVRVEAQYAISTRAGLVNRIQGQAYILRAHSEQAEPAAPDLQMVEGDRLATSFMSRAEIQLNSAAYLRLDELTAVRAINTSLLDTRFELTRGNLLVQAGRPILPGSARGSRSGPGNLAGKMSEALAFEIVTPYGILTFGKEGLYRIIIEPPAARVEVFAGEVALGGRQQSPGNPSLLCKSGRQLRLTGNDLIAPSVRELKLKPKPFDEFDSWNFPIAGHGTAVRIEGMASATWEAMPGERHPITPVSVFQMRDGQTLSTEKASYLQLRISFGASLYLNQSTEVRAVHDENAAAIFELLRGSLIVDSIGIYPTRPVKIVTAQGVFAIKHGSLIRVDVDASGTIVHSRRGEARWGATAVRKGRRLELKGAAQRPQLTMQSGTGESDSFDRWSAGLLRAGTVTRFEGRVTLERPGGAKLELAAGPPQIRAQLLEGGHMRTENGSRAVLAVGQSWIHLNENSELVATSCPPKEIVFEMLHGAAIIYIDAQPVLFASYSSLKLLTPHGQALLSKSGAYRLDVDATGTTIRVRAGSLSFFPSAPAPSNPAVKVKEGETARFNPSMVPSISGRDDPPDAFDIWSIGARDFPIQNIRRSK